MQQSEFTSTKKKKGGGLLRQNSTSQNQQNDYLHFTLQTKAKQPAFDSVKFSPPPSHTFQTRNPFFKKKIFQWPLIDLFFKG